MNESDLAVALFDEQGLKTAGIAILVVFGIMAVLIFSVMRWIKTAERLQSDSSYRKRHWILMAVLYLFGAFNVIGGVAKGSLPPLTLLGLPVSVLLVWVYLRAATREKAPRQ